MEKKVLVVIGFILLGLLTFCASPLQASSVDGHTEEVEYTGEDTSDTIRVKEVLGPPTSGHAASGHDATHIEGEVQGAGTHNGKEDTHGVKPHETQSEDNATHASLGNKREIRENN